MKAFTIFPKKRVVLVRYLTPDLFTFRNPNFILVSLVMWLGAFLSSSSGGYFGCHMPPVLMFCEECVYI